MKTLKSKLIATLFLAAVMFASFSFTPSVEAQVTDSDAANEEFLNNSDSKGIDYIVLQAGNVVYILLIGNLRGGDLYGGTYPDNVLD